ncbi:hypothetical protein [Streptomyces sp. NPDC091212]|uniref:hypothetical protein n=1 Tax=Streptomyces sp. NPDC091212 TaxID=3155191 RepID=UPI003419512A
MVNATEAAVAVTEAVAAGAATGLLDRLRERVRALVSGAPREVQDRYAEEAADHAVLLREEALQLEDIAAYWRVRLIQHNLTVDNSTSTVTFGEVHAQTNYNVGRDFSGTINL